MQSPPLRVSPSPPLVSLGQGEYVRPLPPDSFLAALAGQAYRAPAARPIGPEQGACATCTCETPQRCIRCGAWCHQQCFDADGCSACGAKLTNAAAAKLLALAVPAGARVCVTCGEETEDRCGVCTHPLHAACTPCSLCVSRQQGRVVARRRHAAVFEGMGHDGLLGFWAALCILALAGAAALGVSWILWRLSR